MCSSTYVCVCVLACVYRCIRHMHVLVFYCAHNIHNVCVCVCACAYTIAMCVVLSSGVSHAGLWISVTDLYPPPSHSWRVCVCVCVCVPDHFVFSDQANQEKSQRRAQERARERRV